MIVQVKKPLTLDQILNGDKASDENWRSKPKFRNWLYEQRTETGHLGALSRRVTPWDDWESPSDLRVALAARRVSQGYFETVDLAEQRWKHRIKHTSVCVQLADNDTEALLDLAKVYGSTTKAMRFAIRSLHARTPAIQSAKKETP